MDRVLRDKKAILLFIMPTLILLGFIIVTPIIYSAYYSTLRWDGLSQGVFVGFKNYVHLFQDRSFIKSVLNSFIMAGLSIAIQIPIALILALVLARGVKGESTYRTIYFIPVVISTVVIGQLFLKIYHPSYGLLNSALESLGLAQWTREWLGDKNTALYAAFAPIVWQYIGYHMLLLYASAKSVSKEIYESAKIDGAGALRTARSITIPLIMPIIKVCVTFALIGSLKVFDLVYILTNGGPVHASEVPSTLMYTTIFQRYMYGQGSAIAIFIILECLVLTIGIQKIFKTKEAAY